MILVKVWFNTEADGSPVDPMLDPDDGPLCYYGPFPDMAAAEKFMSDDWPDDDTDVHDMIADDFKLEADVVINDPRVITECMPIGNGLAIYTQGVQPR